MSMLDDQNNSEVELFNLSKKLDDFIDTYNYHAAISFLKENDQYFKKITNDSLFSSRLFQIDFLKQYSLNEIDYLFSHIYDINVIIAGLCTWQLLSYVNNCKNGIKLNYSICSKLSAFSEYLHRIQKHPHAVYGCNNIKQIDASFIEDGFDNDFLSKLNPADLDSFLIRDIYHSLFLDSFLDINSFKQCNDVNKFVILKCLATIDTTFNPFLSNYSILDIVIKFIKQIFVSDIDTIIKYHFIKSLTPTKFKNYFNFHISQDTLTLINSTNDYPTLAIQLILNCTNEMHNIIFYMLMTKKYNMLIDMAKFDEELMQNNFPIKDFIEYIADNKTTYIANTQVA